MRRYLRIVQIKPFPNIELDIAESVKAALLDKGDVIDIIKDNFGNEVMNTVRFAMKDPNLIHYDNYVH